MNITIIGGSGFVGSRLTTRLLAAGHTVKIAAKRPSQGYCHKPCCRASG